MGKSILMILSLNVVIFLLGVICSAVSVVSYMTMKAQPVLASASAAMAPLPTATIESSSTPLPTPNRSPS